MENKSNKNIIIVLVVLLLISLGVGGYFGYKYFTNKSCSEQQDNNKSKNNDDIITDNVKNDLKNNINMLSNNNNSIFIINDLYKKEITELSDDDKAYLLLMSKSDDFMELSNELESYVNSQEKYKDILKGIKLHSETLKYISSDIIDQEYKKIFDGSMTKKEEYNAKNNSFMISFYYDQQKNIYLMDPVQYSYAGPSKDYLNYIYDYKYDKDKDEYYVYIAVGYIEENCLNCDDNSYYVYTSYLNNTNLKDKNGNDVTLSYEEKNKYIIDDSNYKEFDHFRYSFKKNANGDYIFNSITIVK